jgi:dynein heavy chain
VEDICNLLNNGEIPSVWNDEDRGKLVEDVSEGRTPNEKYQYFVSQCKQNLHVVLTFSPVSSQFRSRLRSFPALVNCTTIDWFLPWPEEALRSTAQQHFTLKMKLEDPHLVQGLVDVAVDMQTRVSGLTRRYLEELRRYYYVTPTSYLELLATF